MARKLGSRNPMRIKLDGEAIYVRPKSPDIGVAKESLGGEFEILRHMLPRDHEGLIVDAGGYIGTAAIKLARMFPRAQVVTIEPSAENYAILEKNVAGISNIAPIKAALVHEPMGPIPLSDVGTGEWGFSIVGGAGREVLHLTDTITLAEVRERFGGKNISVLKMDIEGAEKPLFEHATPDLRSAQIMLVELHDRAVYGCSRYFLEFSKDRFVFKLGGEKYVSVRT